MTTETLSPRDAFMELVKGAFNRRLGGPKRLERQFGIMTRLTELTSVKKLVYPRTIDCLEEVRDIVLDDLFRDSRTARSAATAGPHNLD